MTIVVSVRVNDGIVLASDSATSFIDRDGRVTKVYNNANKIFNLVKVWPIGAMTYGSGSIGSASLSTLTKDLRKALDPRTSRDDAIKLNRDTYTVEEVAQKTRRFFQACIAREYPDGVPEGFAFGYRICGYSATGTLPEAWELIFRGNDCGEPEQLYPGGQFGIRWAGEPEALDRLILGVGGKTRKALEGLGLTEEAAEQTTSALTSALYARLYLPAMPIQDAIDLARFLAETAAKFQQFSLNAPTIGGPVEVATITKHEGFKWVWRKHYYTDEFNVEQEQ